MFDDTTLITHCLLVLAGVQSTTFIFSQSHMWFQIRNIRLRSTSTNSAQMLLSYFARIGSLYMRLYRLANTVLAESEFKVHRSFASGINIFLRFFHEYVIHLRSIISDSESTDLPNARSCITLLNLRFHVQVIAQNLESLASLVGCYSDEASKGDRLTSGDQNAFVSQYEDLSHPLDNPASLLSYLYNNIEMNEFSNERDTMMQPLLFLLFKRSCEPLLQWIQDWIYAGKLQQLEHFSVEQFPVCVQVDRLRELEAIEQDLEQLNDTEEAERVWSKTYLIREHLLPSFLAPYAKHMYLVGLQLNVLRMYRPTHYLLENTDNHRLSDSLVSMYDADSLAHTRKYLLQHAVSHIVRHETYLTKLLEQERVEYMENLQQRVMRIESAMGRIKNYEEYLQDLAILKRDQRMLMLEERMRDIERAQWWRRQAQIQEQMEENYIRFHAEEEKRVLMELARKRIMDEYEQRMKQIQQSQALTQWKMRRHMLSDKRNQKLKRMQEDPLFVEPATEKSEQTESSEQQLPMEARSDMVEGIIEDDTIVQSQPADSGDDISSPRRQQQQSESVYSPRPAQIEKEIAFIPEDVAKTSLSSIKVDKTDEEMKDQEEEEAEIVSPFDIFDPSSEDAFNKDTRYETDDVTKMDDTSLLYNPELKAQISLHELVDQCITQPILVQFETITSITKSIFFNELKLEYHFAALQRYFLLQAGDFADVFWRILFEGLHHGRYTHNTNSDTYHLNTALQTALKLSEYDQVDAIYSERLSFSVRDIPSNVYPGGFLHSLDALEHIKLNYRIEWPLNVIIHGAAITKYRRLYLFLMKLKRISHIQQDMWIHFRHPSVKKNQCDPRHLSLQFFRQEIQHFMTIMEQYIMTQVLHVCISQFMNDLRRYEHERDKSIEHVRELHDQFLDRCLARCLLTSSCKPLMGIIDRIFSEVRILPVWSIVSQETNFSFFFPLFLPLHRL